MQTEDFRDLSLQQQGHFFFLFCKVGPKLGLQNSVPLPYPSNLNSFGLFRSPSLLPRARTPISLARFICSGSILAKPKVCIGNFRRAPTQNVYRRFLFCAESPARRSLCSPHFVQHTYTADQGCQKSIYSLSDNSPKSNKFQHKKTRPHQ